MLQRADQSLFLCAQIRGQGSGWGLPCTDQGWRKRILQICRNGIPEMWRWPWWWGKPGCLERQIGIFTLLSPRAHSLTHTHTHTTIAARRHTRTQFDGKARWKFHLNKLPQLVKVLERCDDLQHIQQPGREETMSQQFSFATLARILAVRVIIRQERSWLFLLWPACVKCPWVQKLWINMHTKSPTPACGAEHMAAVLICCHEVEQFVHSCFITGSHNIKESLAVHLAQLSDLHSCISAQPSWNLPPGFGSTSAGIFLNGCEEEGVYLRLDAQRKILAHRYRGFEVLLALLAHKLSPKMRWPGGGEKEQRRFIL